MTPRDRTTRYLELCEEIAEVTRDLVEAARAQDWEGVVDLLARRGKAMAAIDALGIAAAELDEETAGRAVARLKAALEGDDLLHAALTTGIDLARAELDGLYRVREALHGYLRALGLPRRARFVDRQG